MSESEPVLNPDKVFEAFVRGAVDFVVIGGQAGVLHGSPLPTRDVDLVPDPAPANLERLAAVLRTLDARIRVNREPEGVPFVIEGGVLADQIVWNLQTRLGDLDILVGPPPGTQGYEDLLRDATRMEIEPGVSVLVASVSDLLRMKEAAGRAKDLAVLPVLRALLEHQQRRGEVP